ncbi:MAG: hypothetical protein DYH02_07965 [Candidatus Omnitrophica bacterium COP1]|nr:hypothetical protein [Candidatus Omnitrophica bacterium COP1]
MKRKSSTDEQQALKISDFGLATILFAAGSEIAKVEESDFGRIEFHFSNPGDALSDRIKQHHAGSLNLPSLQYLSAAAYLKSLIRDARRGNGR